MKKIFSLFSVGVLLTLAPLQASILTVSKGNTSSGFNPGDSPDGVTISNVQNGQPAPFDQPCGNDSLTPAQGGNCDATWTFTYANILDTINSASISVGIIDADGATANPDAFAVTHPVFVFTVHGVDFTTAFDTVVSQAHDDSDIYNVYTLNLPSTVFALLSSGSTTVHLALQGPVTTPNLFDPQNPVIEPSNGAALIFSTLTIDHSASLAPTPEPSTYAMFVLGLGGLAAARRRK